MTPVKIRRVGHSLMVALPPNSPFHANDRVVVRPHRVGRIPALVIERVVVTVVPDVMGRKRGK